jgi:hypothetical protein
MIKRHLIPSLLASKYCKDHTEVLKNYKLEQQIELTEHLLNSLRLAEQYVKTKDNNYWEQLATGEKNLLIKYGKLLKPFIEKRFFQYFYFDMVITGFYSSEEFNSLPAEEQELNTNEIAQFFSLTKNGMNNDLTFLYLKSEPQIEIKDKTVISGIKTVEDFKTQAQELVNEAFTKKEQEKTNENKKDNNDDEHFDIQGLADFLKCSKVSIHKYKKAGLPFYRMGRKILFKKAEVLNFMKKQKNKRVIGG